VKPRLVFFGTGPVSLSCLEGIHADFEIEAIITKPDRTSPNGRQHPHPVREWGEANKIPVYQIASGAQLSELIQRSDFSSRVGLVVDFGVIIPEDMITSFELGIVNSHFSLLPKLRGADPITFAILEGLEETGVSLMQVVPALDEGDLLAQAKLVVEEGMTTPQLTARLSELSNGLLRRELPRYIEGKITPRPQPDAATYTRRLSKADGIIDWHKPAVRLEREVRAFIGWPGSRTTLLGREVTVTQARVPTDSAPRLGKPGDHTVTDGEICVQTGDGILAIRRLKPAGKREMDAGAFARGQRPAL